MKLSQSNLVINKNNEISIYFDNLTDSCMAAQILKLKNAFPDCSKGFFEALIEAIRRNNFTDRRLTDSINNLIDNYRYPNPRIADIISFDKRIKLHNYLDIEEKIYKHPGEDIFKHYKTVKINNQTFWLEKAEIEQHNLGNIFK